VTRIKVACDVSLEGIVLKELSKFVKPYAGNEYFEMDYGIAVSVMADLTNTDPVNLGTGDKEYVRLIEPPKPLGLLDNGVTGLKSVVQEATRKARAKYQRENAA
jgi:hypothetical protein